MRKMSLRRGIDSGTVGKSEKDTSSLALARCSAFCLIIFNEVDDKNKTK